MTVFFTVLGIILLLAWVGMFFLNHPIVKFQWPAFFVGLVLIVVGNAIVFIDPTTQGIVITPFDSKGYKSETIQPGIHLIVPWLETVRTYSIAHRNYTVSVAPNESSAKPGDDSISARTSDGQSIFIDASVEYGIDPQKVIPLHLQWQGRFENDFVRSVLRSVIRDVISQYRVEEVNTTKRSEVAGNIKETLTAKFSDNSLVLYDFLFRNITFTEEYAKSIEQKQIAEQTAQQAKFVVEQKKQEAEQARQEAQGKADAAVIAAKGEAESRKIQAEAESAALTKMNEAIKAGGSNLLSYLSIQKLSDKISVMMIPSNGNMLYSVPTPAAP